MLLGVWYDRFPRLREASCKASTVAEWSSSSSLPSPSSLPSLRCLRSVGTPFESSPFHDEGFFRRPLGSLVENKIESVALHPGQILKRRLRGLLTFALSPFRVGDGTDRRGRCCRRTAAVPCFVPVDSRPQFPDSRPQFPNSTAQTGSN
jgi:hypothetical protein